MKQRIIIMLALLINALIGALLASMIGVNPLLGAVVLCAAAFAVRQIPELGVLRAGLYIEVWEQRVLHKLSTADQAAWLDGFDDKSSKVYGNEDAQVINTVDFGVEPDVLINNSDYPIAEQALTATNLTVQLDKYQTKVTPITDDELKGLSFDKIDASTQAHRSAIQKGKFKRSLWNLAPAENTAATPVVETSGADFAAEGRKRITFADIVALKKKFDDAEVPEQGRRLVLCSDHANDILLFDNVFKEKYSNEQSGRIMNLAGFEVYSYVANPYYSATTKKRTSYGATPTAGTDFRASVAFYAPRMVKASGLLKMYRAEAANDPYNQKTAINFRHYFIAQPAKLEAIGAIISAKVAAGS